MDVTENHNFQTQSLIFIFEMIGSVMVWTTLCLYSLPISSSKDSLVNIMLSMIFNVVFLVISPISGAHCNPIISCAVIMASKVRWILLSVQILAQTISGLVVYYAVKGLQDYRNSFIYEALLAYDDSLYVILCSIVTGELLGTMIYVWIQGIIRQSSFSKKSSNCNVERQIILFIGFYQIYSTQRKMSGAFLNPFLLFVHQFQLFGKWDELIKDRELKKIYKTDEDQIKEQLFQFAIAYIAAQIVGAILGFILLKRYNYQREYSKNRLLSCIGEKQKQEKDHSIISNEMLIN